MKKAALALAMMVLALSVLPVSFAIDTLPRNGTRSTVQHFRVFTPGTNNLSNGKPLVVFFATGEQKDLDSVLAFVNKYGLYDEVDINLMCVSFSASSAARELAGYLAPEHMKYRFDVIIDCAGSGAHAGCCLAEELAAAGIIPKELNLGDGADGKRVTAGRLEAIARGGTRVNLYAGSSAASENSRKVMEELDGIPGFSGKVIGSVRPAEVLWKAISEHGLHAEYTCWDVLKLHSYTAENGITVRYCVYLPEKKNPGEKLPVLLYFHGVRDTLGKLRGLGQLIRSGRLRPKGIVILPQAVHGTADADFHTRPYQDAVIELVTVIAEKYGGDLDRLSVSGHSDGGTTAYQIVNGHPGVFAACAPIAGVGSSGKGIEQTYLWVFQGAKDRWVKPAVGLRVVLKCEASGCHAMHYVYADKDHEIQTLVFEDTFTDENGRRVRLVDWLMSKRLGR